MSTRRVFLMTAAALPVAASPRVRLEDVKGEKVTATCGGRALLEYRYAAAQARPYVHPLCFPDGRAATLDGPKDHIHHRGLMLAWSDVNGFDFWGEVNPAPHGRILHQRFERPLVSVNHWVAEGKVLLVERRSIVVPAPLAEGVWMEWTSELTAHGQAVTLSGAKHPYNGLGVRFVASMDKGRTLNSRGTATIEQANGEPAAWCTYYGGPGGVAIFDHTRNPRHPSPFFVMNSFGYLSAAPTFREPFRLAPGETLRFRWGVLSYLGEPDAARLNRRFAQWTGKETR